MGGEYLELDDLLYTAKANPRRTLNMNLGTTYFFPRGINQFDPIEPSLTSSSSSSSLSSPSFGIDNAQGNPLPFVSSPSSSSSYGIVPPYSVKAIHRRCARAGAWSVKQRPRIAVLTRRTGTEVLDFPANKKGLIWTWVSDAPYTDPVTGHGYLRSFYTEERKKRLKVITWYALYSADVSVQAFPRRRFLRGRRQVAHAVSPARGSRDRTSIHPSNGGGGH
jgi:hypothetical protein